MRDDTILAGGNIISVQTLWMGGQKELAKKRNRFFALSAIVMVSAIYATMTIVGIMR